LGFCTIRISGLDRVRLSTRILAQRLTLHCFLPGAASFLASARKRLPPSDVWCILYPSLRHFLQSEIREIDEVTLLTTTKPPVRTLP